jgi:predicted ester cyclase
MSTEQNKVVVQRFIDELWNNRELNVADEIFADECITHQLQSGSEITSSRRDPKTIKTHVAEWLVGFPDLRFEANQMLAEGDRVVSMLEMKGTHSGTWMGLAPTGKEISIRMIVIHRLAEGKIVEDWVLVESLGFFQQLGLAPSVAEMLRER